MTMSGGPAADTATEGDKRASRDEARCAIGTKNAAGLAVRITARLEIALGGCCSRRKMGNGGRSLRATGGGGGGSVKNGRGALWGVPPMLPPDVTWSIAMLCPGT
jgi:hypothetical protein